MSRNKFGFFLVLVIIFILSVGPTFAQDGRAAPLVTPEPDEQTFTSVLQYAEIPRIGRTSFLNSNTGSSSYVEFDILSVVDAGADPTFNQMGCRGGVSDPSMQDYSFYIDERATPSRIYISVYSLEGRDVSLIINGPRGEWICADQLGAQDLSDPNTPAEQEYISIDNPTPGYYDVWIGLFDFTSDRVSLTGFIYNQGFVFT